MLRCYAITAGYADSTERRTFGALQIRERVLALETEANSGDTDLRNQGSNSQFGNHASRVKVLRFTCWYSYDSMIAY